MDIVVPYFRATIAKLREDDPSQCKPFGEQRCVFIIDVWQGWCFMGFPAWMRQQYPWIKLVYVPPRCTPIAQPMDRGIIAKLKGFLRARYSKWACNLTVTQLNAGTATCDVKIPSDIPTMKRLICEWISATVPHFEAPAEKQGIVHCWEASKLLQAWDPIVQVEAAMNAETIFTDKDHTFVAATVVRRGDLHMQDLAAVAPEAEDPDAFYEGAPFMEGGDEDEWEQWVDWSEVE